MQLARRQIGLGGLSSGLLAAFTGSGCAVLEPASASLDLYLLIGQSNMAGRGQTEPADRIAVPSVQALGPNGQWAPAMEPIHFDKPDIVGVGPGRAFGLALANAQPGRRIGLVPCAVGGTRLAVWEPGARFKDTGAQPWDDAVVRIALASAAGQWRGVLFHQGESDANASDAPLYAERLQAFMQRLRTALGNPAIPTVLGQMGRWPDKPWNDWKLMVDSAHQALARSLPHTSFASAEGLQHRGDSLHFDAASARQLGQRYAAAMLALQRRGAPAA
jgi:Carbohydrate esterase, sialic acid-specific acetylesterase